MEIGIHAPHSPEFGDRGWVRETVKDLNVTWAKIGGTYTHEPFEEQAKIKDAEIDFITEELGLKLIIDLRTTPVAFMETVSAWRQAGRNFDVGDVLKHLVAGATDAVKRWGSVCKDWEFWGEYACPFTSGMGPNGLSDAYPYWLPHFNRAVKDVDPDASVWNGGYGCDMDSHFLTGLIQDGAVDAFDKLNWHHYNMTNVYRQRDCQYIYEDSIETRVAYSVEKYDELFQGARAKLAAVDAYKPFVSSEWGLPVVRDLQLKIPPGLTSMVFENVVPVWDSEAPAFLEAWLKCFEENAFETIIIHSLRDSGPMAGTRDNLHWGQYCGLCFEDGSPKQIYDIIKKWALRGAVSGAEISL